MRPIALLLGGFTLLASCRHASKEGQAVPHARDRAPENATEPVPETITETTGASAWTNRRVASEGTVGKLETAALFDGAMPTGVTVAESGRIFVSFPRWGDDVPFTVAEIKDGKPVAYPDLETNHAPRDHLDKGFVSVQSVVLDGRDRLWALDTGAPNMAKSEPGGPKLVGIDPATDQIFATIVFPRNVALPTSYLNDVRFDLRRGKAGFAYISDSSSSGPNAIVVVDLARGASWRKLDGHPSTRADKSFVPIVEGRVLATHEADRPPKPLAVGADGIALSADGKTLYYCPLSSRHLYAVPTDALVNELLPESATILTVKDLGEKGASDGLESDAEGRLYVTNYEANAILRRASDGSFEPIVVDPRVLWPDTLSLANDGYLYFIANQLERQPQFHEGNDLRKKPYELFRVRVDGTRVQLK